MSAVPSHIADTAGTTLQSTLHATRAALSAAERVASLNIAATRGFVEQFFTNSRRLLDTKSLPEAQKLHAEFVQPSIDKLVAYSSDFYGIAADSHQEFSKLAEKRFAEVNENVVSLLEANAPSANDGEVRSSAPRNRKTA